MRQRRSRVHPAGRDQVRRLQRCLPPEPILSGDAMVYGRIFPVRSSPTHTHVHLQGVCRHQGEETNGVPQSPNVVLHRAIHPQERQRRHPEPRSGCGWRNPLCSHRGRRKPAGLIRRVEAHRTGNGRKGAQGSGAGRRGTGSATASQGRGRRKWRSRQRRTEPNGKGR